MLSGSDLNNPDGCLNVIFPGFLKMVEMKYISGIRQNDSEPSECLARLKKPIRSLQLDCSQDDPWSQHDH